LEQTNLAGSVGSQSKMKKTQILTITIKKIV